MTGSPEREAVCVGEASAATGVGGPDLAAVASSFAYLLHAAGVAVTPERSGRFARALLFTNAATENELYWTARITLVSDHSQLDPFDRVFKQVFRGIVDVAEFRGDSPNPPPVQSKAKEQRPGADDAGANSSSPSPMPGLAGENQSEEESERETIRAARSDEERLRVAPFAQLSGEELLAMRALMRHMAVVAPLRRSRRTQRHTRGERFDLRATLRASQRTGGDPVRHVLRRRRQRPRRVVFLCDVSGSMESVSRAYLQLLQCAVGGAHAEAFVFATRLTRLTKALHGSNPNMALQRAVKATPDWSGGTRIGAALKSFNDGWGRRGLARGAVIVIVSDGWEAQNPALVGEEMARLARLAHRIVWVNPRKAGAGYLPLVGGMASAIAYVDNFVSGHTLLALDEVLAAISA